jgi:hypothetical protein
MPISKLSAPQPHELVRKVNELVDALNSGGGGGGGGECAGVFKIAAFNAPCSTLASIAPNVDEGGWTVEIGFNVTDNGDGTVTLSDFGFTYDLNATFFRDYWILVQVGDYTADRLSIATFIDTLVGIGIIKPNPLYGMGIVSELINDKYTYIGFLQCECPPDTEDSSPLQDLMGLLSISYPQIGYTIPEITEYEYNPLSLEGVSKTTTNETTSTSHKTTIDRLKSILEARRNDDIQRH